MRRTHYRRTIRGTTDAWVHCGRPLAPCRSTTQLALVTCRICAAYVAKGVAYGYRESQAGADATKGALADEARRGEHTPEGGRQ